MTQFWEFFTFELKFRAKSPSTYVYFALWFAFEFLCVASESFGPIGNANGKVMLNGPYANSYNYIGASFFGVIVIAAIFGTSILRDFQRDTIQILFTKPISKIAYLGRTVGGILRDDRLCVLGHAVRRLVRHVCTVGRSHAHRAESSALVHPAVLFHLRRADFLLRLSLFPGGRTPPAKSSSCICKARPYSSCICSA